MIENTLEQINAKIDSLSLDIQAIKGGDTLPKDRFLSLTEACSLVGYGKTTIYRLVGEGKLKCYKAGKKLQFKESDLMEWLSSHPVKDREDIERESLKHFNDREGKK